MSLLNSWIRKILMFFILIVVVGALIGPISDALDNYAANDTTFGTVLKTAVLLLIGAGLVLVAVEEFVPGGVRTVRRHY